MIKNHYTTNEYAYEDTLEDYSDWQAQTTELLQKHPGDNFYKFMRENLCTLAEEVAYHNYQETENAWLYLLRATQLGVGIFQSNANDGKGFPFAFDNDYIEVIGKKTGYRTNEDDYTKVLFCAIITRNQEAITELMAIPNSVFAESNLGEQNTEFAYALVDLYRAIFTGGDLASALTKAMESFNPDVYSDEAYFYVSRLEWPQVAIIRTIFSTDAQAEFNEAMEKALLLHQEYYSHEDNNTWAAGVIPLPLAALAALAYQHKGYKFTVPNTYIPNWLTERD